MAEARKLGRLDRAFDPTMPHMSALMATKALPPLMPEVHWTKDKNIQWGMMLNDQLGDCTCAGMYHAMQLWSAYGRKQVITEADDYVLKMYEEFCGYRPGNPGTDQGGVEQDIIRRCIQTGVPIKEGSKGGTPGRSKLKFSGEIDKRNQEDVMRGIQDCGLVYIGFQVPRFLMEGQVPQVWSGRQNNGTEIIGGHCIILPGHSGKDLQGSGPDLVSWGAEYAMDWTFFERYVDEVYALAHPWWIDATGNTPLGIPLADLAGMMQAFAAHKGTAAAARR